MEHVLCIQAKIAEYIWLEMDSDMIVEDDLWSPKTSYEQCLALYNFRSGS